MKNKLYITLAAAALFCPALSSNAVTIYGNQVGGSLPGIYSFESTGSSPVSVYQYNSLDSRYGSLFTSDAFYTTQDPNSSWQKPYFVKAGHGADMSEWTTPTRVNEKLAVSDVPTSLTENMVFGKVFGCFQNDTRSAYSFGALNLANGTATKIADLSVQLVSMASDETGSMFAVGTDGILYSVSAQGELTQIGSTGITPSPKYSQGMVFDKASGTLYWTATTKSLDTVLYTVNTETGAATSVYTFGENTYFTSLYIIPSAPVAGAPADVTDFMAIPEGFTNKVNISFTLPNKTVAGDDMFGAVKYKVIVDGRVIADTQGGPGATVQLSDAPGNGEHTAALFISNMAGSGNSVVSRFFVGEDTPSAVNNLQVAVSGKTVTVTWDAPVAGANGGNINVSQLVYDIANADNGDVLAESLTDCTYTETITSDGLTKLSYKVTPRCGELVGEPAITPQVIVGDGMTPPYEQDFDSADSFDDIYFSTYDANNDGKGWTLYQNYYGTAGNARYTYSSSNDADDWLFTCPLYLEKDKTYTVTFDLTTSRWGNGEKLEVKAGELPAVAGMTISVMDVKNYEAGFTGEESMDVTVAHTGKYYLGFHIVSVKDSYNVDLDNLRISEGVLSSISPIVSQTLAAKGDKGAVLICSDGESNVEVVSMNGTVYFIGVPEAGITRIPAESGIYVVRIAESTYKVIVR